MKDKYYSAKVIKGDGMGKTFGFPTLNLDNPSIFEGNREGVYLVSVKVEKEKYYGLLYFGPRLIVNKPAVILEIFVLDFDKTIYGETVFFQPRKYIRGVLNFTDTLSFKKQLSRDAEKAKEFISTSNL